MNFAIGIINSLAIWTGENPERVFLLILPIIALALSIFTHKTFLEISSSSKLEILKRFFKLFFRWLSLAWFTCIDLTIPLAEQEFSKPKPEIPSDDNLTVNLTFLSIIFLVISFLIKNKEIIKNDVITEKSARYHESIKPQIRMNWKLIVGLLFCYVTLIETFYPVNVTYNSFFLGTSILSASLFYQAFNSPRMLRSFQRPNQFEFDRIMFKIVPLFPVFLIVINNDFYLKRISTLFSSPSLSLSITFFGLLLAFLSLRGLSILKVHQLNPNQRSIVSFPIAIQARNTKSLKSQQIYDAICNCCPQSQIYIQSTSTGFRESKAELTVVDWKEYKKEELEIKRNELHQMLVEALITKIENIEILNFEIKRSSDKQIAEAIPIENKTIMRLINLKETTLTFLKKTCHSLPLLRFTSKAMK